MVYSCHSHKHHPALVTGADCIDYPGSRKPPVGLEALAAEPDHSILPAQPGFLYSLFGRTGLKHQLFRSALAVYGPHPYHHPARPAGPGVFNNTRIDTLVCAKTRGSQCPAPGCDCFPGLACVPGL